MERGVSTVTAMCSLRVRSISRCRNQATEPLDLDVESELDVAGSLTPSNAPILTGHFAQQHRHVIARYAERLQISGQIPIELALGVKRPTVRMRLSRLK